MAENFNEIVNGVVTLVDKHTSDPNMKAPTPRVSLKRAPVSASEGRGRNSEASWRPSKEDWALIEEAANLPEAELVEN